MNTVRLPTRIVAESFRQLRECGAGRAECVLYWCAAADRPDLLSRVVHPVHHAGRGGYEVDSDWVTAFFLDLRQTGETVRVQVHTHPHEAGHSWIDDQYALAPATGFYSLVIPDFATGSADLTDTALVVMDAAGRWSPVASEEVLRRE